MFIRERVKQLFVLSVGAGVLTASVLGCIAFANSQNIGAISAGVEQNAKKIQDLENKEIVVPRDPQVVKNTEDIGGLKIGLASINIKFDDLAKRINDYNQVSNVIHNYLHSRLDNQKAFIDRLERRVWRRYEEIKYHEDLAQKMVELIEKFECLNSKLVEMLVKVDDLSSLSSDVNTLKTFANELLVKVDAIKSWQDYYEVRFNGFDEKFEEFLKFVDLLSKMPEFYDRASVIQHLETTLNPLINQARSILKEKFPKLYKETLPEGFKE